MQFQKGEKIYEGKAKIVFHVLNDSKLVRQSFKDSLTAFNGEKKGSFALKGSLNRDITSIIFRYLKTRGVPNHWVADQNASDMITQKLTIIPLEVVVRNIVAGSLAKRLGQEEGSHLEDPIVELYLKSDQLGDPFINDDHVKQLQLCTQEELAHIKRQALMINSELRTFFAAIGFDLIDFKLEFGRTNSRDIMLADEVTPDTCRLWDKKTKEKFDKDRFRRDLGKVEDAYLEVHRRILEYWAHQVQ